MSENLEAFSDVPASARGHLGLLFYAAAYYLIHHLRCRATAAGRTLDDVFRDFPFLTSYFAQIRPRLPADINWEASLVWLREQIGAWEAACPARLPLGAMREAAGLSFAGVLAFVLAGMVEEEAQFAGLFAAVGQPLGFRRPSLALVQQVLEVSPEVAGDAWHTVGPLVEAGFLHIADGDAPRSEWLLRVPSGLWMAVRGESPAEPFPSARFRASDDLQPLSDLVLNAAQHAHIAEIVPLLASGRTRTLILRGMPGTERLAVVGAIARALGRGVVEVECSPPAPQQDERWRLLGPMCTLAHAVPVFSLDLGPGETFEIPSLPGFFGPRAAVLGKEGGISGPAAEQAITFHLEPESAVERHLVWQRALGDQPVEDLPEITRSFCLPGRYIRQCAHLAASYAAIERRSTITRADVSQACRTINRQVLDSLATRLEGQAGWAQLVVRDSTARELHLLEGRCQHREDLAVALDHGFPGGLNRGVRALFEGPSGTGKTLAARVLASELGLDLYRVDLAAVVNKYIGETEKNLSRVLSRAEDLNVVLLLDEGDALMSRRTDVKSSNDRYANLETNYLLQRLETYTGVVIVTTNAGYYIDSAFRRRMDAVIRFLLPDASERWRLWQVHLPADHRVPARFLEEISVRYSLTGGQIRNISIHAALLALARPDGCVTLGDLREAIQAEHRKSGASFTGHGVTVTARNDEAIAAFLGGIS